jgi:hypothetical protein
MAAAPTMMRAPGLRSSRASSAGSAAAPYAPSRCASSVAERLRRIERDIAVERIGGVHGLHLDQRAASVIGARHGAQGGGERQAAAVGEERALVRARFTQAQREREVATEMTRPSRASPSASPSATEPMPAMAITPSAIQAMKT